MKNIGKMIWAAWLTSLICPSLYANCIDEIPQRYSVKDNEATLELSYCNLTQPRDMTDLILALSRLYPRVSNLKMRSTLVTNRGLKQIIAAESEHVFADTIRFDLSGIRLDKNNVYALSQMNSLIALRLDNANLNDNDAITLSKSRHIKTLSLAYNHIGNDGIKALHNDTYLKHLDLSLVQRQSVNPKKENACITQFDDHVNLNSIYLDLCYLTDADVPELEEKLKNVSKYTRFESLDLTYNNLTDRGMVELLTFISKNKLNSGLFFLIVTENPITDASIPAMANIKGLNVVYLDGIKNINADSVRLLVSNPTLQALVLGDNKISDDVAVAISRSPNIEYVAIFNAQVGSIGAVALASNPSIKDLQLQKNNISDVGAIALSHKILDSLYISDNIIGPSGVAALQEAARIGTIKELHF